MSGILCPVRCSISASRSTNRLPSRLASAAPTVDLPQPGIPMMETFASSCRRRRLTAGMRAAVSSCLPVKCSAANTAWATSISKPPAAVTPQSSARSSSSVRKGLYTTSNTASNAGKAFGSIRHCPTFGNIPQGVVLTMICTSRRCMASLYSSAPSLPVRLAVKISFAPPSQQTAVTVECVPPVPRISTVLSAKSTPWALAR